MNKFSLLLFAFLFLGMSGLLAQATLSIQGTVKNSDGTAVANGKYSIKFSLYTTESGGTPVWTETQEQVQVTGGVYSALLGAANPLNAAFNQTYYLGIAIDGGAEWVPRARLSSSPYALSLVGTSNVFPSSGAVGAGTVNPDPNTQLTVSGVGNGDGNGKLLITAPGDKQSVLWLRVGEKLGGLTVADAGMYLNSPGGFDLNASSYINISAGNNQNVHLYSQGALRAYTFNEGLVVNGRLAASGEVSGSVVRSSGTLWTGNGDISSSNGADLRLYRNANQHIVLRGDGWTQFDKAIYVAGNKTQFYKDPLWIGPNWGYGHTGGGGSFKYDYDDKDIATSILTDQQIASNGFIVKSDARVKKDLVLSNGARDLATLLRLEVTDYRQRDSIGYGNKVEKGFIAQQVEKEYAQAVYMTQGNLPDIYDRPQGLQVRGVEATLTMPKPHGLSPGDRVLIITEKDPNKEYEVLSVPHANAFTVKDWTGDAPAENTFVYGRVVKDFRRVDYDKIHTLNVSATQELARQVEALRKENAALKSDLDSLRAENTELKTADARLEARLRAIEAKLPNH
ncbi:MAG: tail fiber domain-containing protein [Saprospiraceae bacterium]